MINDKIIESYLNCKYKAYRIFNNEKGAKKEFELLQKEQLSICKLKFFNRLLEKHGKNEISKGYKFENKSRTPRAEILVQPTLNTETYQISFDAIEIVGNKKSPSRKLHIPILVTSKERFSKKEKLSIVIKCIILFQEYGIDYEFGRIIYGSDLNTLKFKIEPFLNEAKKILAELYKISSDESQPIIFQKNHCKICEFQKVCIKELTEKDSLGQLRRMNDDRIKKFNNKGIFTVNQLSYTFRPRKKPIRTKNHPYYFSLQALAIREQKVYLYDKVGLPDAKTRVYIDIEGNSEGSFVYLIGVLIDEKGKQSQHTLWADDANAEKRIFKDFINLLKSIEDCHLFYFGKYETRVFKRIIKTDGTKEIKDLLLNRSTNVLSVIFSNLYFPTYSNSLKEIGNFLGCSWTASNPSGIQSIIWRKKWEKHLDDRIKNTLITYNTEDCIALKTVTDFVYEVFNEVDSDKSKNNIAFVKELESDSGLRPTLFGNLVAVSKDFEVINQCAYFNYQRNKIYFRNNKVIRKNIRRKRNRNKISYKPNKIIEIKSHKCPLCKSTKIIHNESKFYKRICLDLRFLSSGIKRWITLYQMPIHYCSSCKQTFMPRKFKNIQLYARRSKIPKKYKQQKGYGHSLLVWVVHQNIVNKMTFRSIEDTAKEYFKLPFDRQRISWELKGFAAEYYKQTYNKIFKKMIQGRLIHADETKVSLKNDNGYIWVLTSLEEVIYIYRPTRETEFLHNLLKDFKGVLITDFYSGYDSLKCPQQKCLIHLIRDLNDDLLKNPFDDELKELVSRVGSLLRNIIKTIDRFGLKSRYLRKHKSEVKIFYQWLSKQIFNSDPTNTLKKRMIKYQKELFLFLEYNNIPWNNNNAEYSCKNFANSRKQLKGKATEKGLETHLILLSIYQTCKYKELSFLDFLLSKERDLDRYIQKQ